MGYVTHSRRLLNSRPTFPLFVPGQDDSFFLSFFFSFPIGCRTRAFHVENGERIWGGKRMEMHLSALVLKVVMIKLGN